MNAHTAGHWWAAACVGGLITLATLIYLTSEVLSRIMRYFDRRAIEASDYAWLLHEGQALAVARDLPAPPPPDPVLDALDAELADIPVAAIVAAHITAKEQ